MKRTLGILAGVVALGMVGYLGGLGFAQQAAPVGTPQTTPATPLRSRIAVLNMLHVVKNYQKCLACEAGIKKYVEDADKNLETKRAQLLAFKKETETPTTTAERRATIEREFKKVQREMQDLDETYKADINKYRGDMSVTLYREIEDAVRAYARANDLELVLFYNDAIAPTDLYNPMNVQRKIQSGGCTPMYIANGMDISQAVAQNLNHAYEAAAKTAPKGN